MLIQHVVARINEAIVAFVCHSASGLIRNTAALAMQDHSSLFSGSIAILVPHPDDEVIGCFYFVQRYGPTSPIDLIYVTEDCRPTVAEVRRREAANATSKLPVRRKENWGFPDGALQSRCSALRERITNVSERYQLILCPAPWDRTPDHRTLAEETYDAMAAKSRLHHLVWYRSTWLTFPLSDANLIIPGSIAEKRRALRSFTSQRALALQNVVSISRLESRRWGPETGAAEGFRVADAGTLPRSPVNALSIGTLFKLGQLL